MNKPIMEDKTRTLIDIAEVLAKAKTSEDVLDAIPDLMHKKIGLKKLAVLLSHDSNDTIKFKYINGYPNEMLDKTIDIKSLGLHKDELMAGETQFINVDEIPDERLKKYFLKSRALRLMIAPLSGTEEFAGILITDEAGVRRHFSPEHIELLNAISNQVTTQIENLSLQNKRGLGAELSNALNDIDKAIASTLDFDEIVERVITLASKAVGADSAIVIMPGKKQWRAKYVYGIPMEEITGKIFRDEDVVRSLIADKIGQPILLKTPSKDARADKWLVNKYNIKSSVDVALRVGASFIGNVDYHYHSEDKKFNLEKVDFLNKVSVSLTLALQNAILFKKQRLISDTLQNALIMLPETVSGIKFSSFYRSATEHAKIGGDFFNIFEFESDLIGIFIGDVSGKGLPVTNITSIVIHSIVAYSLYSNSPSDILKSVNSRLVKNMALEEFVTVFFCIFDKTSNVVTYCNAGHPPAMIKKRNNEIELLGSNSTMLTTELPQEFKEQTVELTKGDILLLYSDGVIEAKGDSGLYGEERLKDMLTRCTDFNLLPDDIYKDISNFTGGTLSDDVAILVITI